MIDNPTADQLRRSFFALLQRLNFQPGHIVDVGAHRGGWTRDAIQLFLQAHYTLIEPQAHLRESIHDLVDAGYKIDWITAGASDEPGTFPFHIAQREDSSSFITPQVSTAQMPMLLRTLNEIVASSGDKIPDIVKIDAEGFDLKVLAGASDFYGITELFCIEALVCAGEYENTMATVIGKMADIGYRMIDITDLNRTPTNGALWMCELAFIRSGSELLKQMSTYE